MALWPRHDTVAKFTTCSTSPDAPDFATMHRWESSLEASADNQSIFGRTANLYIPDRCFVPRRVCKLRLRSAPELPRGATLLLPREGPGQAHLLPGKYDVVIGAAQVVGVLTRDSFAAQLERRGGVPVVNLGRGAAGPHIYTDAVSWALLGPLLRNARAVIICVMAGRSSPSSESGRFSGQDFGPDQLRAYDRVNALERQGKRAHARRLITESLESAARDSAELARRIRDGPRRGGASQSPPRILLTWFSACPLGGCTQLWQYPQYYLKGLRALQPLRRALGAELVDASYAHLVRS